MAPTVVRALADAYAPHVLWTCPLCLTEADSPTRPSWCPGCRASGVMRLPTRRPVAEAIAAASRPLTAEEIVRASWDLQRCPATGLAWSAPTMVLVYGEPGGGKSTLAYQIVAQCSPVTIASLEESPGPPMARKLTCAGMQRRRDTHVLVKPGLHDILAAARAGHAILIDSISVSSFQPSDLRGLLDAGAPLLVGVLHSCKNGDYRGPTSTIHECDIVLRVEKNGLWTSEKNRYGASGQTGGIRGISTAAPSVNSKEGTP